MPANIVKSFADRTDKSQAEVEALWTKAKQQTADKFDKSEDGFGQEEWSYVTSILKKMLGLSETVTSTSPGHGMQKIHKKKKRRKATKALRRPDATGGSVTPVGRSFFNSTD